MDLAVARGASAEAIFKGTGLTPGAEGEQTALSLEQMSVFLDNCSRQLQAGWHIEATLNLEMTHHGPVGAAAASAANLADALSLVTRYIELRAPYAWLTMAQDLNQCRLTFIQLVDLERHRSMLTEIAVLSIAKLIEKIRGGIDYGLALKFDFPRPTYADLMQRSGLGRISFSEEMTQICLPVTWLGGANLMADATLHAAAHHACQAQLEHFAGRSSLELQIRDTILRAHGVAPKLSVVASELNMSGRTLIRKLKQHGTSYQAIVDDIHLKLAQHQLTFTNASVAQIGYSLGFSDPANFGRAFRGWTGVTPGTYRKRPQ